MCFFNKLHKDSDFQVSLWTLDLDLKEDRDHYELGWSEKYTLRSWDLNWTFKHGQVWVDEEKEEESEQRYKEVDTAKK